MVDNQHWHDRWNENRIGFHEDSVNSHLQKYLPEFNLSPGSQIFVPLCGKAHDLAWLAQQGFEVLGVEISRIALEAFFEEHQLEYRCTDTDRFRIYRGQGLTLLEGDFFDLRADDLRGCDLTYDRASLIAMEAPDRPSYYRHMQSILPAQCKMLLITLEYDQTEMRGPPFSAMEREVRENYQADFKISKLKRTSIIDESPRWRKVGLTALDEVVFYLDR